MELIGDPEVDRLYTVPPRTFVAERTAAVTAARQAGDRDRAAALSKLRRPTIAAWLVNLLALRRPEVIAQWMKVAELMREAQRELAGDQLRRLAEQRRTVVSTMAAEARALAAAADPSHATGPLPLAEVEATLIAALTDPDLAARIQAGRLVRAAAPEGLGELPPPQLQAITGGEAAEATGDGDQRKGRRKPAARASEQRAALETALVEARASLAAAETDLAARERRRDEVKRTLADIEATIADLTERRSQTMSELAAAESATMDGRRAVSAARRRIGEAEAALAALESGSV